MFPYLILLNLLLVPCVQIWDKLQSITVHGNHSHPLCITIQANLPTKERTNLIKIQDSVKTQSPLPYRLTNDYLFRAVFQSRPKALEGLCRSILHLSEDDEISVTLRNPIELGNRIENKEFILDLVVFVNNSALLNLEMQMYHDNYWIERSISYTCRTFDNLNHGEQYDMVLPVIHVGFLDYDLFQEHPQFYSTYQLTDLKSGQVYNGANRMQVPLRGNGLRR